jgi:Ca2+-binding EF-hand superfamily protein
MTITKPLSVALIALAVAVPASAQTAPQAVSKDTYTKQVVGRFTGIDTNKDGFLNQAEINAAETRARQQVEAQLLARRKAAFEKADSNKDGSLSYAEFSAAVPQPTFKSDSKDAIGKLDANKDGKVSQAEFQAPAMAMFTRIDTNKDGSVSVEEQRKAQAR